MVLSVGGNMVIGYLDVLIGSNEILVSEDNYVNYLIKVNDAVGANDRET